MDSSIEMKGDQQSSNWEVSDHGQTDGQMFRILVSIIIELIHWIAIYNLVSTLETTYDDQTMIKRTNFSDKGDMNKIDSYSVWSLMFAI